MNELFRTLQNSTTLTISNVSEATLSSAMDVLDNKWGISDYGSNAEDGSAEVLALLRPGSAAANYTTSKAAEPVMYSRGTAQSLGSMSSQPATESVTATFAASSSVQNSLQGQFTRRSSAAPDFSQSSSSNWSQSSSVHKPASSCRSRKLQLHELIGRGAFGSVYRGTWKGQPAAVKVVEHDDGLLGELDEFDDLISPAAGSRGQLETTGSSMTGTAGIVMEAAVSSAVMHSNVVQTYSYHTQRSALTGGQETYVVMEWCEGGSLDSAVAQQVFCMPTSGAWGQQADALKISATLLDIASGMGYLHQMHIVHRDLKLKNVLLRRSQTDWRGFTAKVADFGLSQLIPETSAQAEISSGDCFGTVTYMAPEVLEGGRHTTAADVYAFGIMMYELWTGHSAFSGMSKLQIMAGVVSSGLRPKLPRDCPAWYSSLAAACWATSPTRRPSFLLLVQHFRGIIASQRMS